MHDLWVAVRLRGPLQTETLITALNDMLQRHGGLSEGIGAAIREDAHSSVVAGAKLVTTFGVSETDEVETVEGGEPLRSRSQSDLASLYRDTPNGHLLLLHRSLEDPWARRELVDDLAAAYRCRLEGRAPTSSDHPGQDADHASSRRSVARRREHEDNAISRHLRYWRETLSGLPDQLDLPFDRRRPAHLTARGEVARCTLSHRLQQKLDELAASSGSTPAMVVQAGVAALLTRIGAGTDVPIGALAAPRTDQELNHSRGLPGNPVVLRIDTAGNPSFRELVSRVRAMALAAQAHQSVPFERIVKAVDHLRSPAAHPLFQVSVAVEISPRQQEGRNELIFELEPDGISAARPDLGFVLRHLRGGNSPDLEITLDVATDLFDRASAQTLLARLEWLLAAATSHPDDPIGQLDVMTSDERHQVIEGWNATALPQPPFESLQQAFATQARRTPDATAVSAGQQSLSYAQLDAQAERLAHRLGELGVGPETAVAVFQQRSIGLVLSILAIVKAGGTYVPLHNDYSPAWMELVVEETGAVVLLTDHATGTPTFRHRATVVVVDQELDSARDDARGADQKDRAVPGHREQLAYVMYTSGSTGAPKGVAITHGDVLSLAFDSVWHRETSQCPAERVLMHSPHAFDPSTFELWAPLLNGHQIVVAPPGDLDTRELERVLVEEGVTGALITAGLFRLMAEECPRAFANVREVWTGGDVVSPAAAQRVLEECPDTTVTAIYGPTEITLCCTKYPMRNPHVIEETVLIGAPMDNTRAYVLDKNLQPVPTGVAGELYISGAGLARGYLKRPGLTAERFIADPFVGAGSRMYRTGDLVRWTAEGNLTFIGRADSQVKIRGFRVEPGELEATLVRHPGLAQAAVDVRPDPLGDKRLVAWVVPTVGSEMETADLQAYVADRLPGYMVPSFVLMTALPLTPNAKVDRKALPDPNNLATQTPERPARSAREAILCQLCADVLGLDHVGPEDDFFALGGHSLLVTRLVNRIRSTLDCDLEVGALFASATMAALSDHLARPANPSAVLQRRKRPRDQPLSPAQQRLWFLDRMNGPSPTYNIPLSVRLNGHLDEGALEAALHDVVGRHESLRTVVRDADGEALQQVLEVGELPTLVGDPADIDATELGAAIEQEARATFDLTRDLPLRATLFRLGPEEHLLVLVLHHIAGDGWSLSPLCDDLGAAYSSRVAGTSPERDPLPVQYADYTSWQQQLLGDERDLHSLASRQLTYWRTALAGLPAQIRLPNAPQAETRSGDEAAVLEGHLDADLHHQILKLARTNRATPFMVVQAALTAVLSKLGAGHDISIGAPVSGRTDESLDQLVGFFVNTLVLRTDTSGNPTFRELLDRVRATDLAAYAHQDLPFDRVVDVVDPARTEGCNPLFQVALAFDNVTELPLPMAGLTTQARVVSTGRAKCDLWLGVSQTHDDDGIPAGVELVAEYATKNVDAHTVAGILEGLNLLLSSVVQSPDRRLGEVYILTDDERRELESYSRGPERPLPPATMPELFEAQASLRPHSTAVVDCDTQMSYAELNAAANQLAHLLIAQGVAPDDVVAMALGRSARHLVTLLAIWKAGAAYLPLEPSHPAERIDHMIHDARPKLLLVEEATSEIGVASAVPTILLDAIDLSDYPTTNPNQTNRNAPLHPQHAAYVIYTSGSTGRPKGVVISHRGVPNTAAAAADHLGLTRYSRVLHFASLSFDASVWEIASTFLVGATLVVLRDRSDLGSSFVDLLTHHKVTHATLSPSVLSAVPADADLDAGLTLVLAGEACSAETASRWSLRTKRLLNAYGPTETTVCATVSAPLTGTRTPSIGAPIQNTRVYLLDEHLSPLPTGVIGELYVAGDGLARGYLRRAALTAERFVADPAGPPGSRMYRTGDLARRDVDGHLEFVGRADQQVKLRGHRVELNEVAQVLSRHDQVDDAVVLLRDDPSSGEPILVAYVLISDADSAASVNPDGLRKAAHGILPEHMVPATIIPIEVWPLTSNGKLDESALPDPDRVPTARGARPRNEREVVLCGLFADILVRPTVGVEDDFFALGGHSLLATRLVGKIRKRMGVELSVRTLFAHPTVAALAEQLEGARPAGPKPRRRQPTTSSET